MSVKIENSFKEVLSALQIAKLYGGNHPIVVNVVKKAYDSIKEVLVERSQLTIGIVGEEIAFEKEIFFELSKLVKPGITYLKEKNIERIDFKRGLNADELQVFIASLAAPKDEIKGDLNDYLVLSGVENIKVGKFMVGEGYSFTEAPQSSAEFSQAKEIFVNISGYLNSILKRETLDGLALKSAIGDIINNFGPQLNQILKLNTLKRYDLGTFTHLVNVSILSIYFSSNMGFSRDVVLDIGLSSLLHDIGKLHISRSIIRKSGDLSFQEFSKMQSHTELGTSMLLEYTDTIGIMPAVVSFEHHLKFDLSGYPKVPFPKKPHLVSQIVSICDSYDALSERRSYKSDYPPDLIYYIMMRGNGTSYDPMLLDKFFRLIGVWPVGSIVALTDGRIAVVIGENSTDIYSPIVRVIHPSVDEKSLDLKDYKDTLKIQRYLNPWTEGKEFLHLI